MTSNNKQLTRIKLLKIVLMIVFCLFPLKSFGSVVSVESAKTNLKTGEEFLIEVFVDTEKETVNALEGELLFPSDFLEMKEVRDGNSSINFWVEKPSNTEQGKISFSGITPLGITGDKKFIFSVLFKTKKAGDAIVDLNKIQVLKNDGTGAKASVETSSLTFFVSKELSSDVQDMLSDNVPPEDFVPQISSDDEIFDGKNFLVFSTQDKGKGIRGYEVREGFWSFYKKGQSPYLLQDQSLKKRIYVKAVDMDGNERVVVINKSFNYFNLLYAIIIVMILKIGAKFYLRKKYVKK